MQMTFIFPRRDADVLKFLSHFSNQVAAEREALGVSVSEAAALAAVVSQFDSALLKCEPAVRSKVAVIAKDQACAAAKTHAYHLAMAIGVRSDLSAAQKCALGIRPRKQRTRSQPPTATPSTHVVSTWNRSVVLRLGAGPSTMPGVASVLVFTFVGETFPSDPSRWRFHGAVTRPQCQIDFPDTVPAAVPVWICAAYCSRRGERGPISQPVMTYLQSGGVSSPTSAYRSAA